MSHSQNDEEFHILEAVGDKHGAFLDIGAYDGKTRSNTLALIERGWSGVMVEPSPLVFPCLMAVHGSNHRLKLLQAPVGFTRGITGFWPSSDGVSTSNVKHYEKWRETAEFGNMMYAPQVTIEELFEYFAILRDDLTMVSIDTEGDSADLFLSWPFELSKPKVFCVEYDDRALELASFADSHGYIVTYKSNENVVLVR